MLHHLGDYANSSSDYAGLSKDPFLRPSSTRTGGGAYVAYGLFASILARPQHVRLGANSRNCGLSVLAGSCASPARLFRSAFSCSCAMSCLVTSLAVS